jgi:hypothetical protein
MRRKSKFKRHNGIYHCRYCNEQTSYNDRTCDKCRDTIKCKRCKKRLKQDSFENDKKVCKQ